jgi:hypothetical protein
LDAGQNQAMDGFSQRAGGTGGQHAHRFGRAFRDTVAAGGFKKLVVMPQVCIALQETEMLP